MPRFLEAAEEVEQARKAPPQHPQGWEPHVVWDGTKGTVTGKTTARPKDWDDLITSMGLDPAEVEVVEPVKMAWWDVVTREGTQRAYYAKANVQRRRIGGPDIDDLIKQVRARRPRKASQRPTSDTDAPSFVVALSDWQIGKKGTAATVDRVIAGFDAQAKRLKELRRIGRRIGNVYLIGLGDNVESVVGHYPGQAFTAELNDREQKRLAQRLTLYGVDTFRPLAERIVAPCVGGNHGEKRQAGDIVTDQGDNADMEVFDSVAQACSMNPDAYGHVSFVIPQQTLTLALDISGVIVGMHHGHKVSAGANASAKVWEWWKGQIAGERPVAHAKLLLTGHRHHLSITDHGPRTHIQVPTMDDGSESYTESTGAVAHSGMLSIVVGDSYPMGWGDLYVT